MSGAVVVLISKAGFHFDECYICPYRDDDEQQERTVKELTGSATMGCPVCFIHHHTVVQRVSDITADDKVFREHANPFGPFAVVTLGARIQSRELTFFIQPSRIQGE